MRRTKIVCTIGPSSTAPAVLRDLIAAGMDVARLNFSHGVHDVHRQAYDTIRSLSAEMSRNVAVMADLQGPKIRTGRLKGGGPVALKEGSMLCVTTREIEGDAGCVSTTYANLPRDVRPGGRLLMADGAMELRVERVDGSDIHCRIVRGGLLGEHKGVNLPGVNVSAPSMSEKDLTDLEFALELGVDYVALSYVRKPDDLRRLSEKIDALCKAIAARSQVELGNERRPGIVAKIERPEALDHIDEILSLSDAVMVARGDLGIETSLDDIPQVQKGLIRKCNAHGLPVITATQMLESMMTNTQPTRAEVSDVANAIYDGTDAVMLSGETAAGRFPVEAARTMADIAEKADDAIKNGSHDSFMYPIDSPVWRGSHSNAIAEAVSRMTDNLNVARIVCFTLSGHTARAIARCRPHAPITAITLSENTLRRCALMWGVDALRSVEAKHVDEMIHVVDGIVIENALAKPGDSIIIVGGAPLAVGGVTNFLKLHTVARPS
jgi:pyruvate kinase